MTYLKVLESTPPFHNIPNEALVELVPKLQTREYQPGDYIFRQGESSKRTLFILIEGLLEIIVTNEAGEETVVGVRKNHEFFGETVLLSDEKYPATLRAIEPTKVLLIFKEDFEALLQNFPAFAGYFSVILAERMRKLYQEVVLEQTYIASGLENKPFKKRVLDIMSSPVLTCSVDDTSTKIAQILSERNISALVVLDRKGKPVGIVTDKDLVSKVLTNPPEKMTNLTADMIMSSTLISVPPEAFFYQALLSMIKHQVKHVAVVSGDTLHGIVSMRDIIKARSSGALATVDDIESRQNIEGLIESTSEVDQVLKGLLAEQASAEEIFLVITEFYDRITRKVIQISEQEMLLEGYGYPPVPFCWINMGSGGRKEQTLRTDQDNAIIYEDVPVTKKDEVAKYFKVLAEKVVKSLAQCGFVECKGLVMASNPEWCKSLQDWYLSVNEWMMTPNPTEIRRFTIFLDFRPIYGKKDLANQLHSFLLRRLEDHPLVLHLMAKDDLEHKVPLGLFRQFITEKTGKYKNQIDLKKSVCVHMVDCVRLFALKAKVVESSTLGRLRELKHLGVLSPDDSDYFSSAYETLMMFRLRENMNKVNQGEEADNYINPSKLSKQEASSLRHAFMAVSRMQNFTGTSFRVEGY